MVPSHLSQRWCGPAATPRQRGPEPSIAEGCGKIWILMSRSRPKITKQFRSTYESVPWRSLRNVRPWCLASRNSRNAKFKTEHNKRQKVSTDSIHSHNQQQTVGATQYFASVFAQKNRTPTSTFSDVAINMKIRSLAYFLIRSLDVKPHKQLCEQISQSIWAVATRKWHNLWHVVFIRIWYCLILLYLLCLCSVDGFYCMLRWTRNTAHIIYVENRSLAYIFFRSALIFFLKGAFCLVLWY